MIGAWPVQHRRYARERNSRIVRARFFLFLFFFSEILSCTSLANYGKTLSLSRARDLERRAAFFYDYSTKTYLLAPLPPFAVWKRKVGVERDGKRYMYAVRS